MDFEKTHSLGGQHLSLTENFMEKEKKIQRRKQLLRLEKKCNNCGRKKNTNFH